MIMENPEPTMLGLPQELRVDFIEKYLPDPKDHLNLRGVCKSLQYEIDQVIGIKNKICYDKFSMENPTFRQFVTNAVIRHMEFNYKPDVFLHEVLRSPCKLRSAKLHGEVSEVFLQEFFEQCLNLSDFSFLSEEFGPYVEIKPMGKFQFLKTLNIDMGTVKNNLDIAFKNTSTLLKSIHAPRLTHLKFSLDTNCCKSNFYSLAISPPLLEFMSNHNQIKSLEVAVKIGYKRHQHFYSDQQSSLANFFTLLNPPIPDEEILNRLSSLLKQFKMSKPSLVENIEFEYDLDNEKDQYWIEYFGNLRHLKNLGLKLSGQHHWADFDPLIDNNCLTLTKVYIQCEMRSSINFNNFSKCTNLEFISLHNIKGFEVGLIIYLKNLSYGLNFLPKLETLILDRVSVDLRDTEDIAERKLKVVGLRSVSSSVAQVGTQSGISFGSFMKMLNNRHLDALLLDLDSICVTEDGEEAKIENIRWTIFGYNRTSFFDFSDSDKFRYWKTFPRGLYVEFPFI